DEPPTRLGSRLCGLFDQRAGVAGEIRAAGHQAGHDISDGVDAIVARHAGRHLRPRLPRRQLRLPTLDPSPLETGIELAAIALPAVETLLPGAPQPLAPRDGLAVHGEDFVGDVEAGVGREPQDLLGGADLLLAERRA